MGESVKGIVFSEDRKQILMIMRRDCPVWVLPGGGIDPGESPEEAVQREILEETGLSTKVVRKVARYLPLNRLTRITHFFELKPTSGTLMITEETRAIQFFPVNALPKKIPPPFPDWIADALANHPGVLEKKILSTSYWHFIKHLILHPILMIRFLLSRFGVHLNH